MVSKSTFILILWSIIFSSLTIFWIFKNTIPPAWDQSYYLEGSEHLYQTLRYEGLWSFLEETTKVLGRKAPLLPISAVPLYIIFDSSGQVALVANVLFFIIFVYFFFKLSKIFVGEKTAVGAVLVTSTMPLFYGLVRNYFVEFGLMVLVTIWIYLLSKSEGLTKKNYMFWLGVVSGLGMLMKFDFFLFVAGPLAFVLFERFKKIGLVKLSKILFARSLYLAVPLILIAFPWYFRNIKTVLWHAKRATDPQLLGDYYYGPFYSLETINRFLLEFINFSISGYWFLVLVLLVTILVIRKIKIQINWFLALWFLLPFIVFSIGPNKDYRLLLPTLPAVGLFLSWLIYKLPRPERPRYSPSSLHERADTPTLGSSVLLSRIHPSSQTRRCSASEYKTLETKGNLNLWILLIFPLIIFLNSTLLVTRPLNNLWAGPILISDEKIGDYVRGPKGGYWPIPEILNYLSSLDTTDGRKVIILASEHATFNINNLRYYAKKDGLNLEIKTASYFPEDSELDTILAFVAGGDYLIIKTGGDVGPAGLNRFSLKIEKAISSSSGWENVTNNFIFPDGGGLFIAKRI